MLSLKQSFICFWFVGCFSAGAQDIAGYRFTDFPASPTSVSKTAKPDFATSPSMRKNRAEILKRYTGKVNFAGAYQILSWGCGTGCLTGAMVDVRNGKTYALPELGANNCGRESTHAKDDRLIIKKNSRLLLSAHCGMREGDTLPAVDYRTYEWDESGKTFRNPEPAH